MTVRNKNFNKMKKYGFVFVDDPDICMILRHKKGNVFREGR